MARAPNRVMSRAEKPDWVKANPRLTADDLDCATKRYWRKVEVFRAVDDLIGNVVNELRNTGELANTVLMFTADNGLMDGQHRFPEKTPAYEEAIRVPLWVKLPGQTTPRTSNRMVLNTDLAPTIAQLGQAFMTHVVDGRSIVRRPSSASANWPAVDQRSAGSLANARVTARSTCSGRVGRVARRLRGCSVNKRAMIAWAVLAVWGGSPASIS